MCKNFPTDTIIETERLGRTPGKRPALVKFSSSSPNGLLFKKIAEFRSRGLAIANDLDREDREKRKSIIKLLPKIRELGYTPKMRDTTVLIEDAEYSLEDLNDFLSSFLPDSPLSSSPPAKRIKSINSSRIIAGSSSLTPRRRRKAAMRPSEKKNRSTRKSSDSVDITQYFNSPAQASKTSSSAPPDVQIPALNLEGDTT